MIFGMNYHNFIIFVKKNKMTDRQQELLIEMVSKINEARIDAVNFFIGLSVSKHGQDQPQTQCNSDAALLLRLHTRQPNGLAGLFNVTHQKLAEGFAGAAVRHRTV